MPITAPMQGVMGPTDKTKPGTAVSRLMVAFIPQPGNRKYSSEVAKGDREVLRA